MITRKKFVRRKYENVALVAGRTCRVMYLFWARRCRKSTTLGNMAFDAMSREPGQTVIAASASLLVGSELVQMALNAAEQAIKVKQEAEALRFALEDSTESRGLQLVTANSETGKVYANISAEDYTDLYWSKRLEFRLYFDKTSYSRLMVIAPNPATARGWGGWVFRDEQMFTAPEMERELQIATNPIIDTDPTFRMIYASNLCADDRHPGYEMTLPRDVTEFELNPAGNLYISQTGITVHRVTIRDAYEAGHTLFDKKTGAPLTVEDALHGIAPGERKQNYELIHEPGGTAAVDALSLATAQQRGIGRCASIYVDSDLDFERAMSWLASHIERGAKTGAGFDVATTTKGTSNPSSFTIAQRKGVEIIQPLNVLWKTRDPRLARGRMRRLIELCRQMQAPVARLCIDASNEKYFAEETRQEFRGLVPVDCISSGERVAPMPPGYESPTNYKQYLGDIYCAEIHDNHYVMPPEHYYAKDHRSVIKERGTYNAEVDRDGGHGDTFDSGKLAQFAIQKGDTARIEGRPIATGALSAGEASSFDITLRGGRAGGTMLY